MEYIFTYIANYGFPMVVASFLLFRMDKHLANLEEGIRHMNETLANRSIINKNKNRDFIYNKYNKLHF